MTIVLAAMLMAACSPFGQKRIARLDGGVTASFVKNSEGKWGLSLKGVAGKGLHQDNPVQLALCFGDKAYLQAAGYDKIANNDGRYTATAQVAVSEAIFNVTDVWSVDISCLSMRYRIWLRCFLRIRDYSFMARKTESKPCSMSPILPLF